jgi:hypothetical protein
VTSVGRASKKAFATVANFLGITVVGRLTPTQHRGIMREAKLSEAQVRIVGSYFKSEKNVDLFASPKTVKAEREAKPQVCVSLCFIADSL